MRLISWPWVKEHQPYHLAFGMDENTALVALGKDNNRLLAAGQNGIFIFDTRHTTSTTDGAYIRNVTVSYITQDDEWINLPQQQQQQEENQQVPPPYTISFALWKTPLAGREQLAIAPTSTDIFSSTNASATLNRVHPREFARIACALFNSKEDSSINYTFETDPKFKVTMTKVNNYSVGYQGENSEGKGFISFANLRVDIERI